jgi:23S rRNA pseudouridine2605 synthase
MSLYEYLVTSSLANSGHRSRIRIPSFMLVRLQKIIADAGVTSRRKAEELILLGRVMVNGQVTTQLGSKADPNRDHIRVDGKPLRPSTKRVYLLLNKPVGYVSTVSDPQRRPTVVSLVHGIRERIYPVGRLDYHSSGLLILTNDGELANLLMSSASGVPRTYHVKLEGLPDAGDLRRLEEGITLDGRRTAPCEIRALAEREKPWYEVTLVEGRYHQVRRMFERIGQRVVKLKRVQIAFLTDHGIRPGQFRYLVPAEVARLRNWKRGELRERAGARLKRLVRD